MPTPNSDKPINSEEICNKRDTGLFVALMFSIMLAEILSYQYPRSSPFAMSAISLLALYTGRVTRGTK